MIRSCPVLSAGLPTAPQETVIPEVSWTLVSHSYTKISTTVEPPNKCVKDCGRNLLPFDNSSELC